jgi:hypothetical protein
MSRLADVTTALAGFWSVVIFGSPPVESYARSQADTKRPLTIPHRKLAGTRLSLLKEL